MARMRTAVGVLDLIKEQDPDTEVTLHYVRKIIHSGEFPVTPVGRKKLVDADALIAYIAAGQTKAAEPVRGIRRVPVRASTFPSPAPLSDLVFLRRTGR